MKIFTNIPTGYSGMLPYYASRCILTNGSCGPPSRGMAWEFVDTTLVAKRCRDLCDEPGVTRAMKQLGCLGFVELPIIHILIAQHLY